MEALPFLDKPPAKRQPVYVLFGDEDFLKRRVRDAIIAAAIGDADPALAVSAYPGDKLDFSTARNDLDTLPFLSPCRVVVVESADAFVTNGAAMQVQSERELDEALLTLVTDPVRRARLGAAARALVEANRGAKTKTLAVIAELLPPGTATVPRGVVRPFRLVH